MITISVLDFSEFPGPRYERLGPNSGESFRKEVLLPSIESHGGDIAIILDGPIGYGSSFLEEAFGGLIRAGISPDIALSLCKNMISEDDPSLKDEIYGYVKDAIDLRQAS